MGATVGFTVNFLKLAVNSDLTATATVRRRGRTLCTGDVSVTNEVGDEVAIAVVTYKLTQ
jgi:acyl-coenzyme A thioesterase PaaI-like protein